MREPAEAEALNAKPVRAGRYVLYWMQAAQRACLNPALEHAIRRANELHVAPLVAFCLVPDYPEATERHYRFMLEGLTGVGAGLHARGLAFTVRRGAPELAIAELAAEARLVVADVGYTHVQRLWRERVARACRCRVEAVETEVIVPTGLVSEKEEWSAATLRRKITPHLAERLTWPDEETPRHRLDPAPLAGSTAGSPLGPAGGAPSVEAHYRGGLEQARRRLDRFLDEVLPAYDRLRGDPSLDACSHLSPYLHFGQISPLEVALRAIEAGARVGESAFLEELIVRRELSANFVLRNEAHDLYEGLPEWARKTLAEHRCDRRDRVYTREELEQGGTHDALWNTAMGEMVATGWLHNTMRMYWGKKILEWSQTPEEAFETALTLNNRWLLDGRDPNSYAGVAWCFGKHDRPWPSRPVFGSVRAMGEQGLRRKYAMDAYRLHRSSP